MKYVSIYKRSDSNLQIDTIQFVDKLHRFRSVSSTYETNIARWERPRYEFDEQSEELMNN